MARPAIKAKRGPGYLPNTPMAYLKRCHRKKDIRAYDRLSAYMQRKEGKTVAEIASIVNRSKSTVHNWLVRAQEEGIRARHERGGRGRKCRLDGAQLKQISADLDGGPEMCDFESGQWNADLARQHVKEKFGVEYTKSGMRDIMKGRKFSWKKPRPENPGAASKKEQEEFKERAGELARKKAAEGYMVAAGDNAGIEKARNRHGYGWFRRGRPARSHSYLTREKMQIFGILVAGVFFYEFYDKANADNYIDFLGRVHKKFGKALIFVDNASYHKSAKVKKYLESLDGEIIPEYLPPHAPELNPTEMRRGAIERALAGKIFRTLDETEESVRGTFRAGELKPVKLFDYLTCRPRPPPPPFPRAPPSAPLFFGDAGRSAPCRPAKSRSAPRAAVRPAATARKTGIRRARRPQIVEYSIS